MKPSAADEVAIDTTPELSLELAAGAAAIAAAQRLRYRVFIEEMGAGATVHSPAASTITSTHGASI